MANSGLKELRAWVPKELLDRIRAARRPDETWEAFFERLLELERMVANRAELLEQLKTFRSSELGRELEGRR